MVAHRHPEASLAATITVRRAAREDADTLLDLIDALADYEKLARPDPEGRARLLRDAFSDPPRIETFLVLREARAVGYALVFETYSSFLARPTLFLEDLFVLPEHRGGGAGLALIRWLAGEALRRGCGRMEWMVLTWNELAIRFYDRLGAERLDGWVTYRFDREGLERVAGGDLRTPTEASAV